MARASVYRMDSSVPETQSRGLQWIEPDEDNGHICHRLIAGKLAPQTSARFHDRFDKRAFESMHEPANAARSYLQQAATETVLHEYDKALSRQPYNWMLMREVARFLIFTLRDYSAGL